ncbi:MAG: hypothetical protein QME83_18835 [Thermodesulfobacteriota bacterium]|nr:hypothetical protein [Thermodesulfobacteriota bacterium]
MKSKWLAIVTIIGLIASFIGILAFVTGRFSVGDFFRKSPTPTTPARVARPDRIEYDYHGKWALIDIPSGARAYAGQRVIAEAEVIEILETGGPGPNRLAVFERHFDPKGDVYYEGKITFQFSFGGAKVEKTTPIRGNRLQSVFDTWPSGGP